jgi:hypothetical protein
MVPFVKADLNVLPKAAAVVIACGFGVPNGLDRTTMTRSMHKKHKGFLDFRTVSLGWLLSPFSHSSSLTKHLATAIATERIRNSDEFWRMNQLHSPASFTPKDSW